MENIKERIEDFIVNNIGVDSIDYDMRIFDEGLVNSLFAIELMTYIEKEFQIKIKMNDLDIENFQTINVMKEFIIKKQEGNINE